MQMMKKIKKQKEFNIYVAKNTGHKEFADVLFNKKLISHSMKRIQSELLRNVCKICLSILMIKDTYQVMVLIVYLMYRKVQDASSINIEGARAKIVLVVYQEGGKRIIREQKGIGRIYALSIGTPF